MFRLDMPIPHDLKTWLGRHTPGHLWYRIRLPFRRRRWRRQNIARTLPYQKSGNAVFGAEPVLVIGEFGGSIGLSRGASYDLAAVSARHSDVTVVDLKQRNASGGSGRDVDRERKYGTVYLLCQPDNYARVLDRFAPDQLANAYRIGRWVWETPIFPKAWAFSVSLVHEIWSASEFSAKAFEQTGLPVVVQHHDVTPPRPTPGGRAIAGVADETFFGLAIMDIQSCPDRKNPWAHVRAWQQAFGDDPAAVLVMKIRVGKRTRLVLDELRRMIGPATNIRILTQELSADEIAALQTACDVYLSLHRSEGYGLNIAECLMLGRPVLATHWSANTEFGPSFPNYVGVPFHLVRYDDWLLHYEDSTFHWAEADTNFAAEQLKQMFQNTRNLQRVSA